MSPRSNSSSKQQLRPKHLRQEDIYRCRGHGSLHGDTFTALPHLESTSRNVPANRNPGAQPVTYQKVWHHRTQQYSSPILGYQAHTRLLLKYQRLNFNLTRDYITASRDDNEKRAQVVEMQLVCQYAQVVNDRS